MLSLRLAIILRPQMNNWADWIRAINTPFDVEPYFYLLFPAIWIIVFMFFSIYDPQKHLRFSEELGSLILACLTVNIVIPGMLYFIERLMSRVLFVTFAFIAAFMLIGYRIIYRLAYKHGLIKTHENRRILIVGAGIVGRDISKEIQNFPHLGFEVIGFVDDDQNLIEHQSDVFGSLDDVKSIVEDKNIQHVIVALPLWAHKRMNNLLSQIHELPIRVWVVPDYFSLALNQAGIQEFAGFPLIDLRAPALSNQQRILKRIFDLLVAVPLFIVTLPLMILISVLIKIGSDGPVFYTSTRMKEFGETFEMIKFRTMKENADRHLDEIIQYDENGNPIHKRPDDPRVTKVGKLLRKTSLDELPQLINIIKGDMSLVGPRPELPKMVQLYEPWQRARFAVPQGLTGWWQVNGRSDKPMHLHTDEDLYYIQHYSLWFDIRIILRTILVVLRGKGAY